MMAAQAPARVDCGLSLPSGRRLGSKISSMRLDRTPSTNSVVVSAKAPSSHTEAGTPPENSNSPAPRTLFETGTMDSTTSGATLSFSKTPLRSQKLVVFMRHGYSTWNEEKRIQGSSEESQLTPFGETQALRCKEALTRLHFDSCFSSPIPRALKTAELMWTDREGPLVLMDELREADLGILQGMRNDVAAVEHADLYRAWRDCPADFCIDGRYPVVEVFDQATTAWEKILSSPGVGHLVVTHKSLLRAMLCTALGLPPSSFRSIDVSNAGICTFRINKLGEPMLTGLNLTSHLHTDGVSY